MRKGIGDGTYIYVFVSLCDDDTTCAPVNLDHNMFFDSRASCKLKRVGICLKEKIIGLKYLAYCFLRDALISYH
jgi:hypothetical protein